MADWFTRAFGASVDEARNALADARSKLIDEAWFGRKVPEPHRQPDLGWTTNHPPVTLEPDGWTPGGGQAWRIRDWEKEPEAGEGNFLDHLRETAPEHFVDPPSRDADHGIDR